MKIVYLVNGPLTSRWQSYYCLDAIAEHYNIEFWDCSRLMDFPNKVTDALQRPYVVDDILPDNFEAHLQSLPHDTVIVPEIPQSPSYFSLFKKIAKYVTNVVDIDFWQSPLAFNITTPLYAKNTNETLLQRIKKVVSWKLFKWWWKTHFKTFAFSCDPDTQYTLNYPDVEKFHLLEQDQHHRTGRYVVYIGQYFPFHSDTQRLEGEKVIQLAPSFYQSMNKFFERVENELRCEVIIAEHPSAKHSYNPYNGRQILYYQTAELIRDSLAVCMHFSNSSSFVILYDKPIALLECEAIRKTIRFSRHNKEFAAALGREPVDIDTVKDIPSVFLPIDRNIRNRALSILLHNGNQTNAELFVKYFAEIEKQLCRK